MRSRYIILSIVLGLFFGFALWSKYVDRKAIVDLDFAVTVKLQEKIDTSSRLRLSSIVGDVLEGATFFASPEFSVGIIGLISLIGLIKAKGWKKKIQVFAIPLFFGLLVVGEIYGKTVVHHPAPPYFMIKNPTTIFPKFYINEQFSYPSGHTARAVYMAIVLSAISYQLSAKRSRRRLLMILSIATVYVLLVSISRIYLGHHWLSDVIGGMFLGSGLSIFVVTFL